MTNQEWYQQYCQNVIKNMEKEERRANIELIVMCVCIIAIPVIPILICW